MSVAVTGVLLYNNPLTTLYGIEIDVKLFSYLYLYVMLMMVSYPILRIKEKNIISIQRPSYRAFYIFSIIMVTIQIMMAFFVIPEFLSNLSEMINDPSYGVELYGKTVALADTVGHKGINIIGVLSGLFSEISILILMFYLTFEKKNKFLLSALILSILIAPLGSLAIGQRGASVRFIFEVIVCFLIFKRFMPHKSIKYTKITLLSLFFVIVIPFVLLTSSRFARNGQDNLILYQIESYLGQSFINFSNYGLDAGGIRNGDRTATLIKMALFDDTPRNLVESLSKYRFLKMDESSFYTFVGDFTLDYGPLAAVIMFLILTLFFRHYIVLRRGRLLFHQVILMYFLLNICCGIFLFPFAGFAGNMKIIAFILFYLFFKIDYSVSRIKERRAILDHSKPLIAYRIL